MDDSTPTRMTSADMIQRLWQRTNLTRTGIALCVSAVLMGCSDKPAARPPAAKTAARPAAITEAPPLRYPAEALARYGELRLVSLEFPVPPTPQNAAAEPYRPRPYQAVTEVDDQPVPPPDEEYFAGLHQSQQPTPTTEADARRDVSRLPQVGEYSDEYADATDASLAPKVEEDATSPPAFSRWSRSESEQDKEHATVQSLDAWNVKQPEPVQLRAEPANSATTSSPPSFAATTEERDDEPSVVVDETVRRLPLVVEAPAERPLPAQPATVRRPPTPHVPYITPNPAAVAIATRDAAMGAVNVRTEAIIRHAFSLAHRGAQYSARAELVESLRMISQALDVQSGDRRHSEALAAAFRALEEAEDFIPRGTALEANLNMAVLARGHKTPVLKDEDAAKITPLTALQRYYTYAQEQLIIAGGHERNASVALYGLGRLESLMHTQTVGGLTRGAPQAMVFHQAAMMVDPANYKAANELGVLLARYGQYEQAREVLVHSVRASPQPESWRNLAAVHEHLGQADLARRATFESQLAARHQPASGTYADALVRWVEPEAMAGMAGDESYIPAPEQPVASETGPSRTRATPAAERGESRGLMRLIPWRRGE